MEAWVRGSCLYIVVSYRYNIHKSDIQYTYIRVIMYCHESAVSLEQIKPAAGQIS